MTSRLTQTLIAAENARRQEEAEFAVARVREMTERTQESLKSRTDRLNEAMIALARVEARGGQANVQAELRVEIRQLQRGILRDREAVDAVATLETTTGLGAAVESQQLGLHFAVADERHPRKEDRSLLSLVAIAVIGFLILVPTTAIFIGAFDSRVHEVEDVSRLGLPVIGHVPAFLGDDVGSMAKRGVPALRPTA
jgi:hypothetical protein